ncbi:MAG: (d)CMP kinase [Ezakiella sp.]|nr:(d)CMP kinase [Ezakiella sp.]MDD7471888.1 (d)CMP kinase [Bacillota bacterium]MDY3923852.1 (d)CMP kinase [Ezakiella sp.]
MIITLDGPSGSGKSTLAKKISKIFDITHIDSGSIYRAIAYSFMINEVTEKDYQNHLKTVDIGYEKNGVTLNGKNLKNEIRTSEVSDLSSKIATEQFVRDFVDEKIREIANKKSVVVDGRDIGSTVLPNADYKFFIEADVKKRATRRRIQLKRKNPNSDINIREVQEDLIKRDERDKNREISPLRIPEKAYIIDTTNDSIKDSIQKIIKVIKEGE